MRTLLSFVVLGGVISHLTASAQVPGKQSAGSEVDFSGVYAAGYVGLPIIVIEPDVYPFTTEAERAYNAYDPLVADPRQVDCAAEAMPAILWSTNPMQIIQEDGRVVIRFEEDNATRSIPMDDTPPSADYPHTGLGYSVGHWVGEVLTIETTHMTGGIIANASGYPISREARITERYWREPGENDLQMELLIDDPLNYTEPLTLGRKWVWSPDEQVRPWECVSLGPRDSEPTDIDGLVRTLEEL